MSACFRSATLDGSEDGADMAITHSPETLSTEAERISGAIKSADRKNGKLVNEARQQSDVLWVLYIYICTLQARATVVAVKQIPAISNSRAAAGRRFGSSLTRQPKCLQTHYRIQENVFR